MFCTRVMILFDGSQSHAQDNSGFMGISGGFTDELNSPRQSYDSLKLGILWDQWRSGSNLMGELYLVLKSLQDLWWGVVKHNLQTSKHHQGWRFSIRM